MRSWSVGPPMNSGGRRPHPRLVHGPSLVLHLQTDKPMNIVQGMTRLPPAWAHLINWSLSGEAEEVLAFRSCGDRIVMLGPGSAGLLATMHLDRLLFM